VFTHGSHHKPYSKKSCIKQLQLEQDSGKSIHEEEACRYVYDSCKDSEVVMAPKCSEVSIDDQVCCQNKYN
jgi:Asp-tRNA(Asn)/Glu-tRNA(Gln) amidotransferase B subunit